MGDELHGVLDAAQSGAGWALESLYRNLAPAVAGYLRVQGAHEPDDLTNEVFVRVFRDVGSFSGTDAQFRSWVFSIAHARLIDDRRRRARRARITIVEIDAVEPPATDDVERDVLRSLAEDRVRELCARVAPDQRDVLLLRLVGDLSLEQTAAVLAKTVGAVKALQRRGLAALRRELEREGVSL
ncbi:MAG: RNA polymerase sigma factor [Acidimicrobiia bacterium]